MTTTRRMITRRMDTRPGTALVALTLLAAVAACGSPDPSADAARTTPTHSTASATPPHDFPAAQRVTVLRSGGLKPVRQQLVFALDQPAPDGFTRADVVAVLAAAANPQLKLPPPDPGVTCCDRYVYRVSISYPDGTTTSFMTVDDAPTTPAMSRLLRLAT